LDDDAAQDVLDAFLSMRTLFAMKASTEQAEAIKDRIAPMLHRLKARTDSLPNDPLYVLVTDARESLHSLWIVQPRRGMAFRLTCRRSKRGVSPI
jgi:hypothetical protein